ARTAVDLCPAGDAGLHVEAPALPRGIALDLVRESGARADEAHVSAHDVPELRQLVDRQPPQQPADARDARIARVDGEARALLLRINLHRPELHELEFRSVYADTPLAIEDGAAVLDLDRRCCGGEKRAHEHESDPRGRHVERTVHRVPSA